MRFSVIIEMLVTRYLLLCCHLCQVFPQGFSFFHVNHDMISLQGHASINLLFLEIAKVI